jgi:KDO2-lipid IV(A) lauroyltransferase
MEYVQYKGRTRDNKYQIGKREIRNLYKALQENECVIYLPDQDYGKRKSVFVPFFAEPQACTTTGTSGIAKESNCKVITTIVYRNSDKSGYTIKLSPALDNYPTGDDEADATRINKLIETNIMYAPEQYMWLHRRFKTRPNSQDKGRIYQR